MVYDKPAAGTSFVKMLKSFCTAAGSSSKLCQQSSLLLVTAWSWLGAHCLQMLIAGASAAGRSDLLKASIIQSTAEHLGLAL